MKIKIDCLIRKKNIFLKEKQKQSLSVSPGTDPLSFQHQTQRRWHWSSWLESSMSSPPPTPPPPASPLSNITPHPGRKVVSVAYKVALVDIPVSHRPCQTTHIYLPKKKKKQDTVEAAIQFRYLLCSISRDNVHQFHCNSFIFLKN